MGVPREVMGVPREAGRRRDDLDGLPERTRREIEERSRSSWVCLGFLFVSLTFIVIMPHVL
ncbi:hypothetical protein [Frankia sp. ACN10a]|uniref:hypothetical protein n=1 Tax=Frankia sp. ACN10a TaxID=2926031 RepID=UPI00211841AC|nr:hypothetical protein [Frankia sp. ACN10a]